MSLYDDVDREALHDWLNERDALRADEMPDRSEYEDEREPHPALKHLEIIAEAMVTPADEDET